MRAYILSERERKIVKAFLEQDLNLDGFSMLKLRAKRAFPQLEEDIRLLKKLLNKAEIRD